MEPGTETNCLQVTITMGVFYENENKTNQNIPLLFSEPQGWMCLLVNALLRACLAQIYSPCSCCQGASPETRAAPSVPPELSIPQGCFVLFCASSGSWSWALLRLGALKEDLNFNVPCNPSHSLCWSSAGKEGFSHLPM